MVNPDRNPRSRPMSSPHLQLLPAPPWLHVQRIPLIRREVVESLSASALELLWSRAEVVVEGDAELGAPTPGQRFYASVMVTIDLATCSMHMREPSDAATALRLAELLAAGGDAVRKKLLEIVRPELSRLCGQSIGRHKIHLDHDLRADGSRVLIDGDAWMSLESARKTSRR